MNAKASTRATSHEPATALDISAEVNGQALARATLVVCSRNRPRLLENCVNSVLQGNDLPAEIVVIDQSDSRNESLASRPRDRTCPIRYYWTPSAGVSKARNQGIARAAYDVLVFADDDILASSTWFGSMAGTLTSMGRRTIVSGKVLPAEELDAKAIQPEFKADEQPAIHKGRVGKDVLLSGSMALYRDAVDDVGTFDERLGPGTPFPGAEDNDFGFRLLEAGYRVIYAPNAVSYHVDWRSQGDYLRLRWKYGLGRGGFYAKHIATEDRHMLGRMIDDVKTHLLAMPGEIRLRPRRAAGHVALIAGIATGFVAWTMMWGRPHRHTFQNVDRAAG